MVASGCRDDRARWVAGAARARWWRRVEGAARAPWCWRRMMAAVDRVGGTVVRTCMSWDESPMSDDERETIDKSL